MSIESLTYLYGAVTGVAFLIGILILTAGSGARNAMPWFLGSMMSALMFGLVFFLYPLFVPYPVQSGDELSVVSFIEGAGRAVGYGMQRLVVAVAGGTIALVGTWLAAQNYLKRNA